MLHDLRRQLRQQRQAPGLPAATGNGPLQPSEPAREPVASPAPFAPADLDTLAPLPADLATELAAVRDRHPRLHASLAMLNAWQLQAVFAPAPSLLVRAQVGSGKTAVLVHRVLVLHLLRGAPLHRLAVVTFTRKAAGEIRARIEALAGDGMPMSAADFWLFGTFHGVARSLLTRALPVQTLGLPRRFSILDESAREALWRHLIAAHDLDVKYPAQLASRMDALRHGRTRQGAMKQDDDLARLRDLARAEKLRRGVLDFDDLLDHATQLLPIAQASPETAFLPPLHILVDEFQDCEPRELDFLRNLRTPQAHFFAVGDPYQSIYAWRGGSPQLFDAVQREFGCQALSLPVNYRSTPAILACARAVLGAQHGVVTDQGTLQGTRQAGEKVIVRRHHDAFHEAVYVRDRVRQLHASGLPLREVAVLTRTRRQLQAFSAVLKDAGIAFEESSRASLAERPAVAWLLHLLRAALHPKDLDAARDALLHPQFGCLTGRQWTRKALETHQKKSGLQGLPALAAMLADKPAKDAEARRDLEFARAVVQHLLDFATILDIPAHGGAERMWADLGLQRQLRPTAARHAQDAQDVRRFLAALEGFATTHASTLGAGLRHALDEIALHGVGVVGETVDPQSEAVRLLTLHASKGLEFRHVFLSGVNQGVVPLARTWGDTVADAEERRLLFVGLTRAKDSVELGWHGRPPHPQALGLASPYLLAMPALWTEWLDGSQGTAPQPLDSAPEPDQALPEPSPWQPGVKVRHPRYGLGEVLTVAEGTVSALFAKFGERSFPLLLCPLAVV